MDFFGHATSIPQPLAWLVAMGFKDVLNTRVLLDSRHQNIPGYIHARADKQFNHAAALSMLKTRGGLSLADAERFLAEHQDSQKSGGIVGEVVFMELPGRIVSPWTRDGFHHWLVVSSRPLPFSPCKGGDGFFEVRTQRDLPLLEIVGGRAGKIRRVSTRDTGR